MDEIKYFEYGETEINYLKKKDKKLSALIDRVGIIRRPLSGELFESLIRSIVAQQISSKAAVTVTARLKDACGGEFTPDRLVALGEAGVQQCGMSLRKAGYIINACECVLDGRLDIGAIGEMSDAEAVKTLACLHGIGEWTGEMLLLFSLARPDIFSYGDLAIRKGVMMLYGHKKMTKQLFEKYRKRYSPYGSVASLYFWHIANNELF